MRKATVVITSTIAASVIAMAPASATASTAKAKHSVSYAMSKRNHRYEYGKAGPTYFDCSGLTYASWKSAGVSIPRVADAQWHKLKRVKTFSRNHAFSFAGLRPGDIVVFGYSSGYADHVALYVGDGAILDASASHTSYSRTTRSSTRVGHVHLTTRVGKKNNWSWHALGVVRP